MSTIVLRQTKGSALTFAEGDANFENLNDDKLENITSESIGDLSDVTATTPTAGQVLTYMASGQWENQDASAGATQLNELSDIDPSLAPSEGQVLSWNNANMRFEANTLTIPSDTNDLTNGAGYITSSALSGYATESYVYNSITGFVDITGVADGYIIKWDSSSNKFLSVDPDAVATVDGNVTSIDDQRNPNTITLDNTDGIAMGDTIQFQGTDVTSAGLMVDTDYYLNADVGSGAWEISDNTMTPVTLTALGSYTDFTYSVTPAGSGSGSNLSDLSDVNVAGATDGDILKYDSGSMQWQSANTLSNITLQDITLQNYVEGIYDIGSNDSPGISANSGAVQTVSITSGLSLNDWASNPGESVTLIVSGTGTLSGTSNYKFAGGATDLTSYSIVSIFYDGTTYWTSVNTDFQ